MTAVYKYESVHKDTGVTKMYQVDNYTVAKNGDNVRIIGVEGNSVVNDLVMAEIKDAIANLGR